MDFPSFLQMLHSLAEGYGIPAYAVDVILTFAFVLILGRSIISLFLRISYRRLSELSPETKSSYIGVIHIVALAATTLSAFLDLRLAAALAFAFLVLMPIAVGFIASRKERRERKTQSTEITTLRQALRGKKEDVKPKRASTGNSESKRRISIRFRLPSLPLPKKRKKEEKTRRMKPEHKGPALIVEEITFGEKPTHPQKKQAEARAEAKVPEEKAPRQVPPAGAARIKEFRKAVAELEALASGKKVPAQEHESVTREDQTQKGEKTTETPREAASAPPSIDESALVREIEKAVEEKVVRARRHRFITWREVLEMRKRAKETVKRLEPVVKERVRRQLREKGRITKEDLNAIAEEILYQIQRSEALAEPEPPQEEKREKRRREKRKKEKEEELLIGGGEGEEDILALLGEEEPEEDVGGDLEELEKLLREE